MTLVLACGKKGAPFRTGTLQSGPVVYDLDSRLRGNDEEVEPPGGGSAPWGSPRSRCSVKLGCPHIAKGIILCEFS